MKKYFVKSTYESMDDVFSGSKFVSCLLNKKQALIYKRLLEDNGHAAEGESFDVFSIEIKLEPEQKKRVKKC